LEGGAAGELSVFEVLDAGEVLIDEGGIGQRPEMLSRLQFRGIGRQKEQMHLVGQPQLDAGGFPAGPIEDEHDLFGGTGPDLARERGQFHLKDRDTDGGWQMGQMKDRPTRGGMDKADAGAPGEAVLHSGGGALPDWRPDPPEQRLQTDPLFVGGPQLDLGNRKRGGDRLQERPSLFLQVSCCSASTSA
jgi:hypothetical protein